MGEVCTAAFVISLAALGGATAAAAYTHLGTRAARDIDHRAMTPDLQLTVERLRGNPNRGLLLVANHSGPDLDALELEIVAPPRAAKLSIPEFGPGNRTKYATIDGLRTGERQELTVLLSSYPTDRFTTFRITCRRGRRSWTIARDVGVQPDRVH